MTLRVDLGDLDRYVEENRIADEDLPKAFAQWLANLAGHPITGGEPVDGKGPTSLQNRRKRRAIAADTGR